MYIQMCVKGIAGSRFDGDSGIGWADAQDMMISGRGIISNWWRGKGEISPPEIEHVLTEANLKRHLHEYDTYGPESPFLSLAAGAVERDRLLRTNFDYSAIDTALLFATRGWERPGALIYCWVPTTLSKAVEISTVSEPVRDLLTYNDWSRYQLEGELTAKISIPANQIERAEWWDGSKDTAAPVFRFLNPGYVAPRPLLNLRELF